ncbi:hypothetical protein niasHT_039733 [Heterodera trifolii]|uniref:B30.2/SPRY domain-containing protein n=1 Tax=Heterodera trifolii TaxID=157864 RepID=A0ABD2J0U2_9BILA
MADPFDSKSFGFMPAIDEQQGNSADVFCLGQFVRHSAAVVSSSSIGAAAGDHQQQQQQRQQQPQHMAMLLPASVVKTEQQQQQREKYAQGDYDQLTPSIRSSLEDDRLDVRRQQQQMCHVEQLMKTCESIVGQLTQFQNDQNALLGRIVQLETQQQQMLADQTTKESTKLGNAKQQKKAPASNFLVPQPMGPMKQINFWDYEARSHDYPYYGLCDLEILDSKHRTIRYTTRKYNPDWRTVFAKHSIQDCANSNGLFYFEIAIEHLLGSFGAVVGFALKLKPFVSVVNRWGTLAYQSNGTSFINGYQQNLNVAHSFTHGDVFGLGIYLTTREIFLTKNGHRLVTAAITVPFPIDQLQQQQQQQLFPFVSLLSPADQIEANFGPNFLFANTQK